MGTSRLVLISYYRLLDIRGRRLEGAKEYCELGVP